jgi:hypothetical protein
MKTTKSFIVLASIAIALFACKKVNKDENNITTVTKGKISGYIQKGPFTSGTQVTLYDLNSDLSATGKSYNTQISNNAGSFEVNNVSLTSNFVSLLANGYYYNEVLGQLSQAPVSLTALADISSNTTINVNILTHLEKPRVEYLISQGMAFQAAKVQAQQEVLRIFNINISGLQPSELLNISQSSSGDAILLAVSCILQGYRTEAQLTELLSNISNDIKSDGVLTDSLGSALINHAVYLDTIAIRNNLVTRYNSLGIVATIPAFEPYLRNFIQHTSFPTTETLISYPQSGAYGQNLLSPGLTILNNPTGNFSLKATLTNPYARVKIVLKRSSGNVMWAYVLGSNINLNVSSFDYINYEQTFTSINAGTDCDLNVLIQHDDQDSSAVHGTILIKYYEMNFDNPRWTKTITVTE